MLTTRTVLGIYAEFNLFGQRMRLELESSTVDVRNDNECLLELG